MLISIQITRANKIFFKSRQNFLPKFSSHQSYNLPNKERAKHVENLCLYLIFVRLMNLRSRKKGKFKLCIWDIQINVDKGNYSFSGNQVSNQSNMYTAMFQVFFPMINEDLKRSKGTGRIRSRSKKSALLWSLLWLEKNIFYLYNHLFTSWGLIHICTLLLLFLLLFQTWTSLLIISNLIKK